MKNKKGVALLLTLFIMLFISLVFIALSEILTSDTLITGNLQEDTRATYLAEAGFEHAVYNLQQNDSWTSGGGFTSNQVIPTGGTDYYKIKYPSTSGMIESVGHVAATGFEKTLWAKVVVIVKPAGGNIVRLTKWDN